MYCAYFLCVRKFLSTFCDFCCCCNYWEFFLTSSILKDLKSVFVIRQDYILAVQCSKLVFLYFSVLICKDATSSFRMTLFCTFEILLHFMIIVQSIRPLCQREKKIFFVKSIFLEDDDDLITFLRFKCKLPMVLHNAKSSPIQCKFFLYTCTKA